MRWFPIALLFGASFAVAQVQVLPPPPPPPPSFQPSSQASAPRATGEKPAHLEGTILSLNGDLVRKATVHLQGTLGQPGQPPTGYSETTDNAGKFVFDDVAPGRYTLSAEKPGFVATRYGARSNASPGTQLNLTAGMEMRDLAIKMTPQGVIAGRVLDQDGDPVVSVQVQAMRFAYNGGRKQLQPTGGASTNDLGEYRLINLAPGRYYVSATDRRVVQNFIQERPGRAGTVQEGNITTYYPNGADVSSAVAVEVAAGAEMRGTDIRLLQAKVYTVRGKAVDASGIPPSAFLSLTRKENDGNLPGVLNGGGTTQLRPDGTFEFRSIVPGTYVLQLAQVISLNGNPPADVTGRLEVTVGDSNIDDLAFPLIPRPEITGTVTLEDGDIATLFKPAQNTPGVAVAGNAVRPQPGRLALVLNQTESGPGGGASNAPVKEDGTFRVSGVGLSKYALNLVSLPQGIYLKSARFGGQDVTHTLIDTTSGTGGTLDLVLSSKSAEVTGSVQNEKGEVAAGMMVTLWPKTPDASRTGGVRPAMTDQNGGFQFKGLAPGDYYVAAWEELDLGLALGADFLSHFTSEASAVKLSESGHESKDLKLIPADKVALEIAKLP
ncbi:MAG: carboxypeptidase-like regulatory domain-containing protein [Acidobacteriia bacterium]|nr:carboxypeptidase-like regulatory domain-containing protein [Terriglobia bacterium]